MKVRVLLFFADEELGKLVSVVLRTIGHSTLVFSDLSGCPLYANDKCTCPQNLACGDLTIIDEEGCELPVFDFVQKQRDCGCKGAIQNTLVLTSELTEEKLRAAEEAGIRMMKKPFKAINIVDWINECHPSISPQRRLIEQENLLAC